MLKSFKVFLLVLTFFVGWSNSIAQQTVSGRSAKQFVNITKDPPKPAFIEIVPNSLEFIDPSGNQMIDANESASIRFTMKNSGLGEGFSLKLKVREINKLTGLIFEGHKELGNLKPGLSRIVDLPIQSSITIPDGKAFFELQVDELNGFGTDPFKIEVGTRAFVAPDVKVADHQASATEGGVIQKRKPFDIQFLIQNKGKGLAEQVEVALTVPPNTFCLSGNEKTQPGNIKPGDTYLATYNLVVTNNYSDNNIPVKIKITEKYGKYGEDKTINLQINQSLSSTPLIVEGKRDNSDVVIPIVSLSSEVDKNIPVRVQKNENRFALIIGNEDYKNYQNGLSDESNVEFALNDAMTFRNYADQSLGVKSENIYLINNATSARMRQSIELISKMMSKIGSKAELVFYYAGHGFPDENTKTPYLIPVDVNAADLSSAIKVSELYSKFAATGAGRITIFLDACFTGGGRESGLLAARSVKIKPNEDLLTGKMVVFSASSGDQSALAYKEKKHGMFTYYLLKKLQDSKGNVTYKDLLDYVKENVSMQSLRLNFKEQDPQVKVSSEVSQIWFDWKF